MISDFLLKIHRQQNNIGNDGRKAEILLPTRKGDKMDNKLKAYFPLIRERADILQEITGSPRLSLKFNGWNKEQQEQFLDICTGVKGVKMLYDAFFKEVMNPDVAPELLEEFLSLILKQRVSILYMLPNDASRIADESPLLYMDIIVQLADGSIANVEVQKVGYLFPGERSACYSADLLMRQYKRVRGEKGRKEFRYKDIKNVYTIVLFEKSPKEFKDFPDIYRHFFQQKSDTGLELELLQKYVFIPLDIFQENRHNKVVEGKLDAWLMFFSSDDPEDIVRLITAYPEFKLLYEKAYDICRNMERVMGIFSEELRMLDRNTAEYMIDEMQNEISQQKEVLKKTKEELKEKHEELEEKHKALEEKDKELEEKDKELEEKDKELEGKDKELEGKDKELEEEWHQKSITLIAQVRNFVSEGFSVNKCANMLVTDIGIVSRIYEAIQEHPESNDARILELIEEAILLHRSTK